MKGNRWFNLGGKLWKLPGPVVTTIKDLIVMDGKWLGGIDPWKRIPKDGKIHFRISARFNDWRGTFGSMK